LTNAIYSSAVFKKIEFMKRQNLKYKICQPELVEGGLSFSGLFFLNSSAFDKLRLTLKEFDH